MSAENDSTPAGGPHASATGGEGIQTSAPAAGSTGVQTALAPEPPLIPLPPRAPRPRITPEELGRAMSRLDNMLVVVVLLLGVLLALFPARNSDLWLNLAAARDWLHGKFSLGTDPYSYTGTGSWVNHSWLAGLLFYGIYQSLGGPALLILKAVLITALVGLLLSLRRRGQGLWLPGVCAALAVLALSPRLLMQPAVFSFLFLGITVCLLLRRELREEPAQDRRRPAGPVPWLGERSDRWLWLLPPLVVLWVNLDSWYFVGPLALVLYLGGLLLEAFLGAGKPGAPRPGSWRPIAAVLLVGIVACLLSPFGLRGLNLPDELAARDVLSQLQGDSFFGRLLASPVQTEYFRPDLGLNIAGMAYFPLIIAGLVSFGLAGVTGRLGRVVLFLGFLVLSLAHIRAVPYFAIVAGPIAALNFQEFSMARFGIAPIAEGGWKQWSQWGRALSVLGVFLLAALAWPGWVFGFPGEPRREAVARSRRVGLDVEPPVALVKLAHQLDAWHRDGSLKDDDHILNLQPDVSNTLAWLCQDYHEKCFFDYRFGNYPAQVAGDYIQLRQAFDPPVVRLGEPGSTLGDTQHVWGPLLKDKQVSFIIAYNGDHDRFQVIRAHTLGAAAHLVTLYLDGHSAVYWVREKSLQPQENSLLAWLRGHPALRELRDRGLTIPSLPPPQEDQGRFKGHEFNPWSLAFGPDHEKLPDGKPRRPQPMPWWTLLAYGPGPQAPETGDAATYLAYFNESAFRWHYEHALRPQAVLMFASLAGSPGGRTGGPLAAALTLGAQTKLSLVSMPPALRYDEFGPIIVGPTSPLLLAVRSARRAIQRNPEDAEAYFQLGRAYGILARESLERQVGSRFALLGELREVQAIAALRNAILIKPNHGPAHRLLSDHYARAHFDDLTAKHFGEFIKWFRNESKRPGANKEQFDKALKGMEEDFKGLDDRVRQHQDNYEIQSDKKRVLNKATIALQMGLAEKALQVLLDSDALEFKDQGTRLELELLLRIGRLDDLREQLSPASDPDAREQLPKNLNATLGMGTYELYRVKLAAGEGDYQEADHFLEEAATKTRTDPAMLANYRHQLELEGKGAAAAGDLTLPQLNAVGVARLLGDSPPQFGPAVMLLQRHLEHQRRVGLLAGMAAPLQKAADYETLRGVLRLETGDIPAAEQAFRQALFAGKGKRGERQEIVFDFTALPVAYQYLRMIETPERLERQK